MFNFLGQGIILGLYSAFLPGPFQAFLLSQILKNGWKRSLPLAFIPLFSDGPIMLTLFFVISQLPDWFTSALRIFGGLFILYLAWDAFRTSQKLETAPLVVDQNTGSKNGFLKGITMNLLNPNVTIFWGTIGVPTILSGWEISPITGIAFVIGFYGTMLPSIMAWIAIFGTLGNLKPVVKKYIAYAIVGLMCIVGLSMFINGANELLILSRL